ncbi:MAG: flavodoxin-dependent (E)-4-hydroxy-3-methylbut-2-enyl-diphosphate synthase, partial [Sediminibacterium sp.]|nr:flavodoxin-dependent (E)-4-hydroxy-3-methylbut-2-enyl-diphosphate synthase [Sediminibacterium sp.]
QQVPVVVADLSKLPIIDRAALTSIGYTYHADTDKWSIADAAADYVFIGKHSIDYDLPGTLRIIQDASAWKPSHGEQKNLPIFDAADYLGAANKSTVLNFIALDAYSTNAPLSDEQLLTLAKDPTIVFCISSSVQFAMSAVRRLMIRLMDLGITTPVILVTDSNWSTIDEHLIHFATETGALLLDGMGDGICLGLSEEAYSKASQNFSNVSGRNYVQNKTVEQFLNATAFGILQATRTRISKTEYISCPSCGRTLFELQETTAKIRKVTHHLKGLKIAIMGCIVNGPGEMADADFGYVGSGVGKITLYKGKEVMKRNIDSAIAVDELIQLLKEHNAWVDPQ